MSILYLLSMLIAVAAGNAAPNILDIQPCTLDYTLVTSGFACAHSNWQEIIKQTGEGNQTTIADFPRTRKFAQTVSSYYYLLLPKIGWASTIFEARNVDWWRQLSHILHDARWLDVAFQGIWGWLSVGFALAWLLFSVFVVLPLMIYQPTQRIRFVVDASMRPKSNHTVNHLIAVLCIVLGAIFVFPAASCVSYFKVAEKTSMRQPLIVLTALVFGDDQNHGGAATAIVTLETLLEIIDRFLNSAAGTSSLVLETRDAARALRDTTQVTFHLYSHLVTFLGRTYSEFAKISFQIVSGFVRPVIHRLVPSCVALCGVCLIFGVLVWLRYARICRDFRTYRHTNVGWLRVCQTALVLFAVTGITICSVGGALLGLAAFPKDLCVAMQQRLFRDGEWTSFPLIGASENLAEALIDTCLSSKGDGDVLTNVGGADFANALQTVKENMKADPTLSPLGEVTAALDNFHSQFTCANTSQALKSSVEIVCDEYLSSIIAMCLSLCSGGACLFVGFVMLLNFWLRRLRLLDEFGSKLPILTPEVFFQACRKGDLCTVAECCEYFQPNSLVDGDWANSPLHYAAYYGNPKCVKKLCEQGWQVTARNFREQTPFTACVSNTDIPQEKKLAILRVLRKHGSPVDAYTGDGDTPLMIATRAHETCIVEALLKWGASPYKRDWDYKWTPLQMAQRDRNTEVMGLLEEASLSHRRLRAQGPS
eukprot:Gregarina_sp_Poly_1__6300@NODE_334_length_9463_cov_309_523840_g282_i0_p3_GENE_NODE_334_length_9463_cov_309_523840_g282_i0NODE_334_length_9463_cov_309_523840_g282_i0_p3_ORF_typecomplete_len708_score81_13Ank_2/PF12796_7/4_5e08Ank_2/PF12796_7/4_3e10Ank_5/PF13857_6/4_2e09Ank_5/PF13857_6/7_1e08Ank_4/PF13637_6/4e07Ank_4/PF13637_6/0_00025Ank_4/PF13637_6/0_0092Ank/PF00023_30/2_4e03Ank/PF00023_30/1_9e05Ank/PF00023_30/1_5e03Ank/PF00023_30/0_029Ank_3/PF13606_6/1_2e03Ank_3/PF13606_6/3_8e05Ank_3/PF13606_6/0_